jgi:anti-sigma regulatory factor (Ser/Thr protein kinase)
MPGLKTSIAAFFFLLTCSGYLPAQEQDMPVFKQVSHPFMPAITSEYFYFSADGLIWFSTTRGLTSFDGSEIVYYSTPEQAETLRLSNITVMTEDTRDNLYIGTESKVFSYNRSTRSFTALPLIYPETMDSVTMRVRSLYLDNDRWLYVGFSSIGMQVYDLLTKNNERFDPGIANAEKCECDLMQLNTVSSFIPHVKNNNELWVGTFNGIYLFNKKSKKFSRRFEVENPMINIYRPGPFYCDIRKMDMADDSTIWFSTSSNGFGRYSVYTGKTKLFLHNARLNTKEVWKSYIFRSFARWRNGKYILGITDPHPALFDTHTAAHTLFAVNNAENSTDGIQYATNDGEGNVWVLNNGRFFATVPHHFIFRSISIKKQDTPDYLPNQVGTIYYDAATRQYFAAIVFSSGIYVYDSMMRFRKIIPAPLYTNKWTYQETCTEWITKDGSNRFWASGMETYIYTERTKRFDYAEKVFPTLKWIRSQGEAMDIISTRDGHILVRFIGSTVFHIRHHDLATDSIKMPLYKDEKFEVGTSKLSYDSLHQKLYINNAHAIAQYDLVTRQIRPLTAKILFDRIEPGREIIDYALDAEGRIWVWIPSYGIRIIDPLKLACTDSVPVGKKGLLSGNYNYIRHGGPGFMFIVGGEGIVLYNYQKQRSWLLAFNNGIAGPFPYFIGRSNRYLFANDINKILYYDVADFAKIRFSKSPVLNTVTANDSVVYIRNEVRTGQVIRVRHFQNNLSFSFSAQEFFFPERIEYAYQLTGVDRDWHYTHSLNRRINYTEMKPGNYIFRLKAQMRGGNWQGEPMEYRISIVPAFWQTTWFKSLGIALICGLIIFLVRWRIKTISQKEQQKVLHQKELLDMEAKALRAQMNPHFIFNSLNSIKSLINKNENDKAAEYLTTFSKLIRTLFQNSDKREVSLFEELHTCQLYAQIEKLRFGPKINFVFDIDEGIDLKDIKVPALVLQPFIENAIWHGLVPKESGGTVLVSVKQPDGYIECIIDDDGIGRELSQQYKTQYESTHQSKGIGLTRSRLELDKLLNNREDVIKVIDKTDEQGKPAGTTVIITFKEYGYDTGTDH